MRRILGCIILILFLCIFAQARAKYSGYAQKGGKDVKTSTTVMYQLMETFPACTVTVYIAGTTTLATIYQDNVGTAKANPFTSDSAAYFEFYADNGRYDIKFSGTGIITPFTRGNIYVIDPLEGIFNIKSFGAKCDGVTDDRLKIQAAITIAGNNKGSVYIPGSVNGCLVTNTISVPSNVTIYGDGYGSLVFIPSGGWNISITGGLYGIFNVKNASKVRFTNLRIRGNRVLVVDGGCDGGFPGNCHAPKLIYSETVDGLMLDHCWLENTLWEGIWEGGTTINNKNYIITNNQFRDIDGPSAITGNFEKSIISNNTITDCKFGIGVIGRWNQISNNIIINASIQGIGVGESLPQSAMGNYVVDGNIIYMAPTAAASWAGINVAGTTASTNHTNIISNNHIYADLNPIVPSSGAGIVVQNDGSDADIDSNTIEIDGSGNGIIVNSNLVGVRVKISNNTIKVINELSGNIGILSFDAGIGTNINIFSTGNKIYGITRANSGYAYSYGAQFGGTINAVMVGDIKTEGNISIGEATYNTSGTDNVPLYLASDLSNNASLTSSLSLGMLKFISNSQSITIAGGIISLAGINTGNGLPHRQSRILVHTEGGAAADDLLTINGGQDGDILILSSLQDGADTTLKDATGNLNIGSDFILATTKDRIVLMYDGTLTKWIQLSRSTN